MAQEPKYGQAKTGNRGLVRMCDHVPTFEFIMSFCAHTDREHILRYEARGRRMTKRALIGPVHRRTECLNYDGQTTAQ